MNMAPGKPQNTGIDRAMDTLRASPAKSATLAGLVLIMVIAWLRVLVGGHTGPAAAQAATMANSASGGAYIPDIPVQRHSTEQGVSIQQWARQPAEPLGRNPFAIPMDYYPADSARAEDAATANNGYWNLIAKSMSSRADQQQQRQILIDNVRLAAESLKLQSTIMGATPGAMVNGAFVREGGTVAGFRVLRIEPRRLVIEREGVKLAVEMD
jgi:hypothetical protein